MAVHVKPANFSANYFRPIQDCKIPRFEALNLANSRMGGRPISQDHMMAAAGSSSLKEHAQLAIQMINDPVLEGLVAPMTDKGPLSGLMSHSAYSLIGAAQIVKDRGILPEDAPAFYSALAEVLGMMEPVMEKGILQTSGSARFLYQPSKDFMSFNSPAMTGLDTIAKLAREGGYAVPACNVNNLEMVQAFVAAAALTRSPIILEWSPGAFSFSGGDVPTLSAMTRLVANTAIAAGLPVPVCCHLDHGTEAAVLAAIEAGFSSVMYDATEAGKIKDVPFEDNLRKTKALAERAHGKGIPIEGEIGGKKGSFEDLSLMDPSERRQHLTDPNMALDFVGQTLVDMLAISAGTSHGGSKFAGTPFIDTDLISEIRQLLDNNGFAHVGLVLHGGSDTSPFISDLARLAGGEFKKKPSGTPIDLQQAAIGAGVAKINLDTIFRLAQEYAKRMMDETLVAGLLSKATTDFRASVGTPWRVALLQEAIRKLIELGAAGHAMDYPNIQHIAAQTQANAASVGKEGIE